MNSFRQQIAPVTRPLSLVTSDWGIGARSRGRGRRRRRGRRRSRGRRRGRSRGRSKNRSKRRGWYRSRSKKRGRGRSSVMLTSVKMEECGVWGVGQYSSLLEDTLAQVIIVEEYRSSVVQ